MYQSAGIFFYFIIGIIIFGNIGFSQTTENLYGQTGFRVRADFDAALNSEEGWAAGFNEHATIIADQPFRIRFEITSPSNQTNTKSYKLQFRRNKNEWENIEAHDFPYPEIKSPRVSIVSCDVIERHGVTTNLMQGSSSEFQPGVGISLFEETPTLKLTNQHSEYEWALVVRRYADGPITNENGDVFEFRMIEANGDLLNSYRNPILTLSIPPYHIGGTFVETPGRIGPFQATNEDLYFIMEPTEIDNDFMMIKSIDEGKTWIEVDGVNRPRTDDLESVDARMVDGTIHIIHQISEATVYHSFRTSNHSVQPDTWAVRDEPAGAVEAVAQMATFVVRSDGSMAAFYLGEEKIFYSIRSINGEWGAQKKIDPDLAPNQAGPQAILGEDDTIHLAYYGWDGSIWYRKLLVDGTRTERIKVAEGAGIEEKHYGSVLPLLYDADTDTVIIIYRLENGFLWERRVNNNGDITEAVQVTDRKVITDAVDSQQPAADAVLQNGNVHVLFIDEETRSVYSTNDKNGWHTPILQIDDIKGSWIRGNIIQQSDGSKVYGYVYDAGSEGGSGMNRYGVLELE